jgi:uncharacterized protein (DUF2236 family)
MTAAPLALGALDPGAPPPFGRHSVVRAVVAEPVTSLLVQRALVMDVAHPKVAAAVADHSDFQRHPLRRAWVTADAAVRLVFGDEQVARGAVRQIYGVHDHIDGHINGHIDGHSNGRQGGGAAEDAGDDQYTAHDASLLVWVWATLVDTAETAFTRWVRPFSAAEAEAFYDEMLSFARFLGIPPELLPVDRRAFGCYLDTVLSADFLGQGRECRALAHQVLWFRHRSVPSPLVRVERALALATLDRRIIDRLAIKADKADVDLGRRLDGWLSSYYRRFPRPPTILPALYLLLRRPSIGVAARLRSEQS